MFGFGSASIVLVFDPQIGEVADKLISEIKSGWFKDELICELPAGRRRVTIEDIAVQLHAAIKINHFYCHPHQLIAVVKSTTRQWSYKLASTIQIDDKLVTHDFLFNQGKPWTVSSVSKAGRIKLFNPVCPMMVDYFANNVLVSQNTDYTNLLLKDFQSSIIENKLLQCNKLF